MKLLRMRMMAALLLACAATAAPAQDFRPLPVDPNVRYGKLDNGLTYYIRHNAQPKNQAEFYIAQKVGSVLEEENQRGLAHFLEHMAFNGTEHFPGKAMLDYLESIGVKFGYNINAYTSFDETVYNLSNVPVVREGIVDSCLLVLYDWASAIALEDEEIDKERGVIHEEWRTGMDANMRMWEALVPDMYAGSRYADRMPIGKMEVVDNFPYQVLRDYYHKWYRPDQQGIVVVGDIDAERVEAKVKELFGKIEMPDPAAERVYFEVPDNKEPIVAVGKDKEATVARYSVYYKHDPLPREAKASAAGLVMYFLNGAVSDMFNTRLNDLTQKPNPPFLAAGVYDGEFFVSKTKDAFTTIAVSGMDDIDRAVKTLARETERVNRYGFTASEFERAKADFLRRIENLYNERDKQQNENYVQEYVAHFTDGGSISGIENEYALFNEFVPAITLEQVNDYAKQVIGEDNIVMTLMAPDKEGVTVPTKEALLALYEAGRGEEVEAYVDEVSDEPLLPQVPAAGKVVKTETDGRFGTTVWTLSNGAKVVLKPTDYKNDQILMKASSPGGYSLVGVSEAPAIKFFDDIASLGGLGNFSRADVPKVLAGKRAGVSQSVGERSESVSAYASPKDLETMMQLVYLTFTAPRKDADAFSAWKSQMSAVLANIAANPMYIYGDSLAATVYSRHPVMAVPTAADVEAIDYDRALELYTAPFRNASDFTFAFVGAFDPDTLRPLVETYIASLPAAGGKESPRDMGIAVRKGEVTNRFDTPMESPKTTVGIVYSGNAEYTAENLVKLDMLRQILWAIYLDTLREEEGGTYTPRVSAELEPGKNTAVVHVQFDTNAEQAEKLIGIAQREFRKLAEAPASDAYFNKAREYSLKTHAQNQRENAYWLARIDQYNLNGVDMVNGYEELVQRQSPETIRAFAEALLSQGNRIEVVMNGVKQ